MCILLYIWFELHVCGRCLCQSAVRAVAQELERSSRKEGQSAVTIAYCVQQVRSVISQVSEHMLFEMQSDILRIMTNVFFLHNIDVNSQFSVLFIFCRFNTLYEMPTGVLV